MKPWRKERTAPPNLPPKLEVVQGGLLKEAADEAAPSYRLIFMFLTLAATILGVLIYVAPGNRWRWDNLESSFVNLDEVYKKHGMERFLEQKAQLKQSVSRILQDGSDPSRISTATNIAVYLFPDVLPEENFEKETTTELWGEVLTEIEKHPHTPESRVLFEELRANIWNYELADREDPKLSAPARQVIQLYDDLSAP